MQVIIYIRDNCPYCKKALALLDEKGVNATIINAGADPALRAEMVDRANGRNTFPQIFIGDSHIGGCDDLSVLEEIGRLDAFLAGEGGSTDSRS